MFDVEKYNKEYKFNVNYEDFYKVSVGSPHLDVLFTIDISNKDYDYLSQYYKENGKLKQPIKGEVLALGALYPIVTNEKVWVMIYLLFNVLLVLLTPIQ